MRILNKHAPTELDSRKEAKIILKPWITEVLQDQSH